jgi:hypothetical protein
VGTYSQNSSLYHDALQTLSLGCIACPDRRLCGGLYTREGLFDCQSYCLCDGDASECQVVCRRNVEEYVNRHMELSGFSLEDLPRSQPLSYPDLPSVVPMIYGGSRRRSPLQAKAVAVPLEKLFDGTTGTLRFSTREQLAEHFRWDPAANLIISGVAGDGAIERYWSTRNIAQLPSQIATLEPALITVPNYSLFLNVPREDNLYNMKRIAVCWNEFVVEGLPASLHLNARTDHDWERWTEFVGEREEVRSIAYEFATGAACLERGKWHVEKLAKLAVEVGRALQIVVRGGYCHLPEISKAFSEVVFLDTTSYVKTTKRRRLDWTAGEKKHWRSARTDRIELLDDLLQENVDTFRQMTLTKFVPRLKPI